MTMLITSAAAAAKFDPERAGEYEKQSRIGIAGYDACHELSTCMLAAALGAGTTAFWTYENTFKPDQSTTFSVPFSQAMRVGRARD